MPTQQTVTIWETSEKLPEPGTMIVAELCGVGEWEILMYDDNGIGYIWESDFVDNDMEFSRWFYLSDLRENKQMNLKVTRRSTPKS